MDLCSKNPPFLCPYWNCVTIRKTFLCKSIFDLHSVLKHYFSARNKHENKVWLCSYWIITKVMWYFTSKTNRQIFGPGDRKIHKMSCASSEYTDQSACPRSLIRDFTRRLTGSQGLQLLHANGEDSDQPAHVPLHILLWFSSFIPAVDSRILKTTVHKLQNSSYLLYLYALANEWNA